MIPPMIQMAYTVISISIYITTITNIITVIIAKAIAVLSNQSVIHFPALPQIHSSIECPHPGQLGKSLVSIGIV